MYSVVKCPRIFIFMLLCLIFSWLLMRFIYIINIRYWQVLFITQEELGKSYFATFTFKCRGSTAAVLVLYGISHPRRMSVITFYQSVMDKIMKSIFQSFFQYINFFFDRFSVKEKVPINIGNSLFNICLQRSRKFEMYFTICLYGTFGRVTFQRQIYRENQDLM